MDVDSIKQTPFSAKPHLIREYFLSKIIISSMPWITLRRNIRVESYQVMYEEHCSVESRESSMAGTLSASRSPLTSCFGTQSLHIINKQQRNMMRDISALSVCLDTLPF